jgi:amidohydrolase
MYSRIKELAAEWQPQGVSIRRHLHQYPEIGYHEEKTSAFILEKLEAMEVPARRVTETGVVAEIGSQEPCVAFRVDIDALPIQEANETPYASKIPGMMHACGHDVHTTIGLGVAHVLRAIHADLPGTVRVLFQPAEETTPGGALAMMRAGAIEGVKWIFGIHVDPGIEVGKVGIRYGPVLASADSFELEILARGGHAGYPHLSVDTIQIAAHVIQALHQIVSRRIDPVKSSVISISTIHGGDADNVLPDKVRMTGTFRTLDNEVRQQIPELIEETVAGITKTFGASYHFRVKPGTPVLINHEEPMRTLERAASEILGAEKVVHLGAARMGAEDFAQYVQVIPGAMVRLGVAGGPESRHSLHSSRFDVDERAISVGVQVIAGTLVKALAALREQGG